MENTKLPSNLPAEVNTIIQSLDDLQAQDMVCLDIKQSSSVAEYLVICTSKSHRHGKSLAQNVIDNHPKDTV